jgi:hypothetical protein
VSFVLTFTVVSCLMVTVRDCSKDRDFTGNLDFLGKV